MGLKKTSFTLKEISIRDLFIKSDENNPSYEIPLYQRSYSWGKEQIECLLDDISMRVEDGDNHYFGIIAISNKYINPHAGRMTKRVIDGQQRITTSILIIDWLIKKIDDKSSLPSGASFADDFPWVSFSNEVYTETSNDIKQLLTKKKYDRKIVSSVVKNNLKIIDEYFRPIGYYEKEFYIKLLNTFLDKFFIGQLLYTINEKNEMLVFENLNSKGSPLSEYDLIKNLIISNGDIGSAKENLVFFNKQINNLVSSGIYMLKTKKDTEKVIVDFFEKYIIFKTNNELKKFASYKVYKNLKQLFKYIIEEQKNDFEWLIFDIKKYFILYLELLPRTKFKFLDSNKLLSDNPWFGVSQKNIHISLVFKLYEKYSTFGDSKWEYKDEIEKHIKEWTKFIIKLIVIDGTGQSLMSIILELLRQVNFQNSIEKFKAILWKNEDKKSISMKKFKERMLERSKNDWINRGVLNIIEYEYTKKMNGEVSYYEKILEHIMPQKPKSPEWNISNIDMETKFQDYVNLIGNLGFLRVYKSSKLSNNSFIKKKDIFYHDSIYPLLTKSEILGIQITPIIDMNEWNFNSISKRTQSLVDIICVIFQD